MDVRAHWEKIYEAKAPDAVSWYRPHLETSLALIEDAAGAGRSAAIIDVGGGESTLVDDLLAHGFQDITVLDISATAFEVTKNTTGYRRRARALAFRRHHANRSRAATL
jgi:uncharacterized radical SAM superfamily Fe-S cluster-containing enzyme